MGLEGFGPLQNLNFFKLHYKTTKNIPLGNLFFSDQCMEIMFLHYVYSKPTNIFICITL